MKTSVQLYAWLAAALASAAMAVLFKPTDGAFWIAATALGMCVAAIARLVFGEGQTQRGTLSREKIGPASAQDVADMRRVYFHR